MWHDCWQLLIECSDIDDIPQYILFILPNMGPDGEHLETKVFVEGRKADSDGSLPHESEKQNNIIEKANSSLTRSTAHDTMLKHQLQPLPHISLPPQIFIPSAC